MDKLPDSCYYYYKIVKTERSNDSSEPKLFSSVVCTNPELRVEYIPNEWVYPKIPNSKLFVFGNLMDIRFFYGSISSQYLLQHLENGGFQLWKCIALKPVPGGTIMSGAFYSSKDSVVKFWKTGLFKFREKSPKGTYFVDAVKLIERIR